MDAGGRRGQGGGRARVHHRRLPGGYDAMLEQRGSNLSLGQRQLLSFARALVADAKILVLDEATANIDSYTERLIQKALAHRLLEGRTGMVIAHRLATIRGADRIIVLQNGELIETGNHDQLMEKQWALCQALQHELCELRRPARQCRRQCRRGSGEGDLGRSAAGAVGDPLRLAGEGARLQSPRVPHPLRDGASVAAPLLCHAKTTEIRDAGIARSHPQ
jgi:hypothetical protein